MESFPPGLTESLSFQARMQGSRACSSLISLFLNVPPRGTLLIGIVAGLIPGPIVWALIELPQHVALHSGTKHPTQSASGSH